MTVVLPQQTRGPGVLDSGWLDYSAQIHPGVRYSLTALLTPADLADPTLTLTDLTLQVADSAAGANARVLRGPETWTGGVRDRTGAAVRPSLDWSSGDAPKAFLRATATLPRTLAFGVDLSAV